MVDVKYPLVTVAIPAYNAVNTLDETLRSVRRQSFTDLDIIVVDDGSTDGTLGIANNHADQDPRIRVVHQSNQGVSAARNVALSCARGTLLATIDADDIWHPEKIAHQVATLRCDHRQIVLNYTWFAYIDPIGRIIATAEPCEEGDVLRRMCRGNLLGNGSSPLMLTDVLREVGGWDVRLVGGNEDYKMFFLLAERGGFSVVRAYLTGYRQQPMNRSSKTRAMLSSYDQVLDELVPRHPEHVGDFAEGRLELIAYLFDKAIINRNWAAAFYLFQTARRQCKAEAYAMLRNAPLIAGRIIVPLFLRSLPRSGSRGGKLKGRPFAQLDEAVTEAFREGGDPRLSVAI